MTDDWTPAEARIWARRFRKVGFSPVTLHYDADGRAIGERLAGGCYLRCNWPYAVEDLPLDLLPCCFVAYDQGGFGEEWSALHWVTNRDNARWLLTRFRLIRFGMGSRPIASAATDPWEAQFIPAGRLRADADDRSLVTKRHPDDTP